MAFAWMQFSMQTHYRFKGSIFRGSAGLILMRRIFLNWQIKILCRWLSVRIS